VSFSEIALQLALAAAPYIVPLIIAGLTMLVKSGLEKLPSNQRALAEQVVRSAVAAVEQVASGELNSSGKKALAGRFVEDELAHFGISIPSSIISTLIESVVFELNQAKGPHSAGAGL